MARLVLGVVLLPIGAWVIGVNWVFCLLLAGAGAAAAAIVDLPGHADEPAWPVPEESRRAGGRREVTNLSWMLTSRHGGTDRAAVLRLRDTAARRLALRGVDLHSPADTQRAVELLGPAVHWILTADQNAAPSHRQIVECIDALERLDALPPSAPSPTGHR